VACFDTTALGVPISDVDVEENASVAMRLTDSAREKKLDLMSRAVSCKELFEF
jgi:hypothetical protein